MRKILNIENDFFIKSYQLSHSVLIIENLNGDDAIQIIFEGVQYVEFPRLFHGICLNIPSVEIKNTFINHRKTLTGIEENLLFEIESHGEKYYVSSMLLTILKNNELIFRMDFQNT